eukprot:13951406-Alexandrium_andersonii.AAC.2
MSSHLLARLRTTRHRSTLRPVWKVAWKYRSAVRPAEADCYESYGTIAPVHLVATSPAHEMM